MCPTGCDKIKFSIPQANINSAKLKPFILLESSPEMLSKSARKQFSACLINPIQAAKALEAGQIKCCSILVSYIVFYRFHSTIATHWSSPPTNTSVSDQDRGHKLCRVVNQEMPPTLAATHSTPTCGFCSPRSAGLFSPLLSLVLWNQL